MIGVFIYLTITAITAVVVFFGIPAISTSIAIIAGCYVKSPILIGLSISFGNAIGSVLAQKAGQKVFDKKNFKKRKGRGIVVNVINLIKYRTWRLKIKIEKLAKKYQKHLLPFIVLISTFGIPTSWLHSTVAKDYPKWKIFCIQIVTRCIYFFFISYCIIHRIEIISAIRKLITNIL